MGMQLDHLLNESEMLFYDIEVYAHDAFVVFKDIEQNHVATFHNDFTGLLDVIRGKTLVAFNNYHYDDFILTYMIEQKSIKLIKELNDTIIRGERPAVRISREITSLDVFQQIDISMPSLKRIEANLGKNIMETSVGFDIDRPLTTDELAREMAYCAYDVDNTVEVFKIRKASYFENKIGLLKMLPDGKRERALRWNTTTISANVLMEKPEPKWADIRLGEMDADGEFDMFQKVPREVVHFWREKVPQNVLEPDTKGKYTVEAFGCKIDFGFGGLHGVTLGSQKRFEGVILLDVASLYPNIIIKLNALGKSTEQYAQILAERMRIKHTDHTRSESLKLLINSVYGLLRNQYSLLYNPKAAISVCLYGQIALYDLCERLAPTCRLVNINTDGVAFTSDTDEWKDIWKEWEADYGFTLEDEGYDLFIQKDVNNYIAVATDGYITAKGGDVRRFGKDSPFNNNSLRIVDIALVDHLINGADVLDTILEHLDQPHLFQMVLQAGRTYKGTFDEQGKMYQRVNRIFPVKRDGVRLFKQYVDGRRNLFPNAPDQMLVWNDEVDKLDDFGKRIDINFYYTLINETLERWV